MKRTLYYLSPLVLLPAIMLLLIAVDNMGDIRMSPVAVGGILGAASATIAIFSGTKRYFDGLISVLIPVSLCIFMFLAGFFDAGETYSRFDLFHAAKIAFQDTALILYALLAATAAVSSLRPIRMRIAGKRK